MTKILKRNDIRYIRQGLESLLEELMPHETRSRGRVMELIADFADLEHGYAGTHELKEVQP